MAEGVANSAPVVQPRCDVALPPLVLCRRPAGPHGFSLFPWHCVPWAVLLAPICGHCAARGCCVGRVMVGLGAARRHRCVGGGVRVRVVLVPASPGCTRAALGADVGLSRAACSRCMWLCRVGCSVWGSSLHGGAVLGVHRGRREDRAVVWLMGGTVSPCAACLAPWGGSACAALGVGGAWSGCTHRHFVPRCESWSIRGQMHTCCMGLPATSVELSPNLAAASSTVGLWLPGQG